MLKPWKELSPGDRIEVKGVQYTVRRVTHILPQRYPPTAYGVSVTLEGPSGTRTGTPAPDGMVEYLGEEVEPIDLAACQLQVALGARIIGTRDEGGLWSCPIDMDDGDLALHLRFFHGGASDHIDETVRIPHAHN